MKLRLTLSLLLFTFCGFSQSDHVVVQKKESSFPRIAGVFDGEISYLDLCDTLGITSSSKLKIIQYTLTYSSGRDYRTDRFLGNTIPDSICAKIGLYNIGQMVFFTNIMAMDENGKLFVLTPMNLTPIRDEE